MSEDRLQKNTASSPGTEESMTVEKVRIHTVLAYKKDSHSPTIKEMNLMRIKAKKRGMDVHIFLLPSSLPRWKFPRD